MESSQNSLALISILPAPISEKPAIKMQNIAIGIFLFTSEFVGCISSVIFFLKFATDNLEDVLFALA